MRLGRCHAVLVASFTGRHVVVSTTCFGKDIDGSDSRVMGNFESGAPHFDLSRHLTHIMTSHS